MDESVWKILITTCRLHEPGSLWHTLGSCHHYVAINLWWGKPPGLSLTSQSATVSKQEFNQGRREQQSKKGRKENEAKQPKFFLHPGRKYISFKSHALQIQRILTGGWLQHFELLRKANVRRKVWPICLQTLLFLGSSVRGWTHVTPSRGSASRK